MRAPRCWFQQKFQNNHYMFKETMLMGVTEGKMTVSHQILIKSRHFIYKKGPNGNFTGTVLTQVKNSLEQLDSRSELTKERISKL